MSFGARGSVFVLFIVWVAFTVLLSSDAGWHPVMIDISTAALNNGSSAGDGDHNAAAPLSAAERAVLTHSEVDDGFRFCRVDAMNYYSEMTSHNMEALAVVWDEKAQAILLEHKSVRQEINVPAFSLHKSTDDKFPRLVNQHRLTLPCFGDVAIAVVQWDVAEELSEIYAAADAQPVGIIADIVVVVSRGAELKFRRAMTTAMQRVTGSCVGMSISAVDKAPSCKGWEVLPRDASLPLGFLTLDLAASCAGHRSNAALSVSVSAAVALVESVTFAE